MHSVIPFDYLSTEWGLLIGFLIGIGFGFVLEQAGFSSSRKLTGVFYGYDFVVIKVFFTAVLVSMIGIIIFNYMDWIDLNRIYVNEFYLYSTVTGGLIMGFGMIMSGFCPGTGFSAASIGKIDAMFFIVGIFLGIFLFAEGYPLYKSLHLGHNLGGLKLSEMMGITDGVFAFIFILIAVVIYWIIEKIEPKFARPDITKET
jgi:uncharacterized membrane protein YedE/YeeE